jgi:hypothetical protein
MRICSISARLCKLYTVDHALNNGTPHLTPGRRTCQRERGRKHKDRSCRDPQQPRAPLSHVLCHLASYWTHLPSQAPQQTRSSLHCTKLCAAARSNAVRRSRYIAAWFKSHILSGSALSSPLARQVQRIKLQKSFFITALSLAGVYQRM